LVSVLLGKYEQRDNNPAIPSPLTVAWLLGYQLRSRFTINTPTDINASSGIDICNLNAISSMDFNLARKG
jgi:hypothetical protein